MSRLMKAGQWDPKQKAIVINEIPIPEPGPGQILVKIISASLCATDMMAFQIPGNTPRTLGHEGAGQIAKIHKTSEEKGFKIGDSIGFLYHIGSCGECDGCRLHSHHCEKGVKVQGVTADGFFAQYAVVDWQNAIQIPDSWDLRTSSVFFCAGLTAFHAVDSCRLNRGEWLGVVGAGGVGQLAIQYARAMGINVVAMDISDEALQIATTLGATKTFNSKTTPDFAATIHQVTGGGVHAAAVFSGAKIAYQNAVRMLRLGGLLMVVGIMHEPLGIDTLSLAMGKYRVSGENVGKPDRMKKAIDFTTKHKIAPTVEFRKMEDLPQMVRDMQQGTVTKRMVVNPWAETDRSVTSRI